jgi:poly-gamma-glutamate system protein
VVSDILIRMAERNLLIKREKRFLLVQASISLLLLLGGLLLLKPVTTIPDPSERKAYNLMRQSLEVISDHCLKYHINLNPELDARATGLIGPEWSEITTTAGDLEAKRSTVNPNFAVLMMRLLREAGVRPGDTIALNCSGSFPALMIASISAAQSMGLITRTILSIGSSSFGASNPEFTIVDQYLLLLRQGLFSTPPIGWAFGGELDSGADFDPGVVATVAGRLEEANLIRLEEGNLQSIVRRRIQFFEGGNPGSISAFINTGGSLAGMGTSPLILKIKPGLVRKAQIPVHEQQGLIFAMLERKIPVIHLLHIKGLVRKHRLPWDPGGIPAFDTRQDGPGWLVILMALVALTHFIQILVRFRMLQNRG